MKRVRSAKVAEAAEAVVATEVAEGEAAAATVVVGGAVGAEAAEAVAATEAVAEDATGSSALDIIVVDILWFRNGRRAVAPVLAFCTITQSRCPELPLPRAAPPRSSPLRRLRIAFAGAKLRELLAPRARLRPDWLPPPRELSATRTAPASAA